MKIKKEKPDWKIDRERELRGYALVLILYVITFILLLYTDTFVDWMVSAEEVPQVSIKKDCGLYAGFTDIDWNVAYDNIPKVEENTTEVVSEVLNYDVVNEDEVEELAHLIYAEAGDNSYKCLLYVGSVVVNRKNDKRFPNTIHDVIYEGNGSQYPTIKWMWGREPSENAYKAAREVLTDGSVLPADVLAQTGFYIDGTGIYKGWEHYEKVDTEYFSRNVWRYR